MAQEISSHFIRRTFLAGLLILLPLFITYVLIAFLFNIFTGVGAPVVTGLFRLLGLNAVAYPLIPFVNLLLSLAVIFSLGLIGTNILGRRILTQFEKLLLRLPLVRSIYSSVKQVVETFQGPGRSFQRVVLIEYPRKGVWTLGLVATERHDALKLFPSENVLTVFIPTTPNPTSGYLVIVSPEDVRELDFTIEEAFKFIVSGGIAGRDLAPLIAEHEPSRAAVPPKAADTPAPSPPQEAMTPWRRRLDEFFRLYRRS
jgi:uncharacterized membrane protein